MEIEIQRHGRAHLLHIVGCMTMDRIVVLDDCIKELLNDGARYFVLRMLDVHDLSSTGLARILSLQHSVQGRGGAMALLEPSAVVEHVLDLARLSDQFRVYTDPEQALDEFGGRDRNDPVKVPDVEESDIFVPPLE